MRNFLVFCIFWCLSSVFADDSALTFHSLVRSSVAVGSVTHGNDDLNPIATLLVGVIDEETDILPMGTNDADSMKTANNLLAFISRLSWMERHIIAPLLVLTVVSFCLKNIAAPVEISRVLAVLFLFLFPPVFLILQKLTH